MPFFLQTGASSSGLIGRDASEMSVSPAQNFSKPPPVPEIPTVTFTFGFCPWNASAAAWVNGPTVLEPSILIVPLRLPPPPPPPVLSSPPHAATPRASAPHAANARSFLMRVVSFVRSLTLCTLPSARLQSVIEVSPPCEKRVKGGSAAGGSGASVAVGLGREPIPEAEMGVNEALFGEGVLQLVADLSHVHVHRSVLLAERLAPHRPVKLRPAHDPALALGEGRQQLELTRGQA